MHANRHAARVVLVTGAASGIGAAIARQYAREGAGVALIDVNADALVAYAAELSREGATVAWACADVSDYGQCEAALSSVQTTLGASVDTLVNNAGISPKTDGKPANFWEMAPSEWNKVVGVNLNGAFNFSRLVTPGMVERRFGSIVNMSSVAGKAFVAFTAAHYGTTKAAVIGLTKSVAVDYVKQGVRCNCICPGTVQTPSLNERIAANAGQAGSVDQARAAFIARQAMGRLGSAEEIAALAVYLASEESQFVTGQALVIDGGWTL